jgi:hypothetical protein
MAMLQKKFINIDTNCHSHYNFFSLSLMVDGGTSTYPGSAKAKLIVVLGQVFNFKLGCLHFMRNCVG